MHELCRDTDRRAGRWGRVGVLGAAGLVGSGVAAVVATEPACRSLHLLDVRNNVLSAHVIDIREAQVLAGATAPNVLMHDAADAPSVDLVVVAASRPETADGDRGRFLAGNLDVLRALLPTIVTMAGDDGAVLVLSNPVDELADALCRMSGLDPRRIVGYSLNDSLRFRIAVARELGVDPSRVEGWVLGRHGSGQVPLFGRVRLDGREVALTPAARNRVEADIGGWFARWSALRAGRSSGWTTAVGAVRTIAAMHDGRPHPASVWTGDVHGLEPTHLTLPAVLSPRGLGQVLPWRHGIDEWRGLREAASTVRRNVAEVLGG